MKFYHGSSRLFDHFDLSKAGEGTGVKFGFGIYLTESEASAVHYSQPRNLPPMREHYLYTVEIPALTENNHLVSAQPVNPAIVKKTEEKLGRTVPKKVTEKGKEFRKWVGCALTGAEKASFEEEKAAAAFFEGIGVFYNVYPQAQSKPDGLKNCVVFNAERVHIVKVERIEIEEKRGKNVLVSREDVK